MLILSHWNTHYWTLQKAPLKFGAFGDSGVEAVGARIQQEVRKPVEAILRVIISLIL